MRFLQRSQWRCLAKLGIVVRMRDKILHILAIVTGVFGGLTVVTLLINIILNYTELGHTIPDLDLWAGAVAAMLGLTTLILAIAWHQTEEPHGKLAVIASEAVLFPLLLMLLYGLVSVLLFVAHTHTSIH